MGDYVNWGGRSKEEQIKAFKGIKEVFDRDPENFVKNLSKEQLHLWDGDDCIWGEFTRKICDVYTGTNFFALTSEQQTKIVLDVCNPERKSKKETYAEYLNSNTWKNKRLQVFARDGNKCVLCNSTEGLNAHHRTYENIFNEPLTDLITLCKTCHKKHHKEVK